MTTSGTTTFALSNASITLAAYSRIQIRRPMLLAEHMTDAYNELNLMLGSWSNVAPNLWTVDLQTITLVAGTTTYSVPADTIMIMDMFRNVVAGNDQLMFPISRTDYASYTDKTVQGIPTVFWFDRLVAPTVTLWQVPDGTIPTVQYYRCVQIQDANLANGETPQVQRRFLDAMVADLAHRLARIWKPELEAARMADAEKAWNKAATADVENVDLVIAPMIGSFFYP